MRSGKMSDQKIWLSWNLSRRSQALSQLLGVRFCGRQVESYLLLRHLGSALWTAWVLIRFRPKVVFLQHSFLLTLIVAFYSLACIGEKIIVVDVHTKAFLRDLGGPLGGVFRCLREWSLRRASVLLVANKEMARAAKDACGRILVLPDPLPVVQDSISFDSTTPYVVFPASYDWDEPWEELVAVAERIPDLKVLCTGRPNEERIASAPVPENVIILGWIEDNRYWALLRGADAVLALTRNEMTSQSAAIEAIAAGTPVIASRTGTLRRELRGAAVFVRQDLSDLPEAIGLVVGNRARLRQGALAISNRRSTEVQHALSELIELLPKVHQ